MRTHLSQFFTFLQPETGSRNGGESGLGRGGVGEGSPVSRSRGSLVLDLFEETSTVDRGGS